MKGKIKNRLKRGRLPVVLGGLGVLAVAGLTVAVILLAGRSMGRQTVSPSAGGRGTIVTSGNTGALQAQAALPPQDTYYRTRMSVTWAFGRSTEPSATAVIENAPDNARTVYVDVTLADTGALVYTSPFIEPGGKLQDIALSAELPAGVHDAVATYHLVDGAHREITTVSVAITLEVSGTTH